jgi:hypothetical protein
MTKQEFSRLAEIIKAFYPRDLKMFENDLQREAWFFALGDMDYETAQKAAIEHAKTSEFPPSIADIRRKYDEQRKTKVKTPLQAYLNVKDAVFKKDLSWSECCEALDERERKALKDFGFWEFLNAPNDEFTEKRFIRYYENACTDLVISG